MDAVVDAATLDAIEVPRDLCEIRAFVRWEEAGKPNDTTKAWQEEEFRRATEDLKREVASGTTLNAIRRRYGRAPVEGDDEAWRAPGVEAAEAKRVAEAVAFAASADLADATEERREERTAKKAVRKVESVVAAPPPPPRRRIVDVETCARCCRDARTRRTTRVGSPMRRNRPRWRAGAR
jgi:alpha-glucan,water dikinase